MGIDIIIVKWVSQAEKDKYHMTLCIWGIWKGMGGCKWTCLQIRNRVTDVKNKYGWLPGNGGDNKLGDWDWYIYTAIHKIYN